MTRSERRYKAQRDEARREVRDLRSSVEVFRVQYEARFQELEGKKAEIDELSKQVSDGALAAAQMRESVEAHKRIAANAEERARALDAMARDRERRIVTLLLKLAVA